MMEHPPRRPITRTKPPIVFRDGRLDPFSREAMRAGIREFIVQHNFTHALTLNTNRDMSIDNVKKLFGKFCYNVDQDRFRTKRVDRLISSFRFSAIALIEHPLSHPHLHAAINLHPTWLEGFVNAPYIRRLDTHWKRITKGSGSIQIDRVSCAAGWSRYITKGFRRDDDFILSTDFHPDDSLLKSSQLNKVLGALAP
jgi:hypothetical protein